MRLFDEPAESISGLDGSADDRAELLFESLLDGVGAAGLPFNDPTSVANAELDLDTDIGLDAPELDASEREPDAGGDGETAVSPAFANIFGSGFPTFAPFNFGGGAPQPTFGGGASSTPSFGFGSGSSGFGSTPFFGGFQPFFPALPTFGGGSPSPNPEPNPEPDPAPDPGTPAGPDPSGDPALVSNSAFEAEVIRLTNEFRTENGLGPVSFNAKLASAAQGHSDDMALGDYFSHVQPDGDTLGRRLEQVGYDYIAAGENIAAGQKTPQQVVQDWIGSAGHRQNMLKASYDEIGIGYTFYEDDTGSTNYHHYWTQVFGTDGNALV